MLCEKKPKLSKTNLLLPAFNNSEEISSIWEFEILSIALEFVMRFLAFWDACLSLDSRVSM